MSQSVDLARAQQRFARRQRLVRWRSWLPWAIAGSMRRCWRGRGRAAAAACAIAPRPEIHAGGVFLSRAAPVVLNCSPVVAHAIFRCRGSTRRESQEAYI